jgi:hypothetical protein
LKLPPEQGWKSPFQLDDSPGASFEADAIVTPFGASIVTLTNSSGKSARTRRSSGLELDANWRGKTADWL